MLRGRAGEHTHVLSVFSCPGSQTWRLVALRGLSHFILPIGDGIGTALIHDARRPAVREPLVLTENSRPAGDEERLRVRDTHFSSLPFLGECERLSHRSAAVPDRLADARPLRSTALSLSLRSIKFWTTSASRLFDARASSLK
jgi:hypothetical protein